VASQDYPHQQPRQHHRPPNQSILPQCQLNSGEQVYSPRPTEENHQHYQNRYPLSSHQRSPHLVQRLDHRQTHPIPDRPMPLWLHSG
jgi:hypothetical protein